MGTRLGIPAAALYAVLALVAPAPVPASSDATQAGPSVAASPGPESAPSDPPPALGAASALFSRSRLHGKSGTVEGYDSAAHVLTVRTAKGLWKFAVATARVWVGSRSVGLEDLASSAGDRVSVKYSEANGERVASTVRLTVPKHPRP